MVQHGFVHGLERFRGGNETDPGTGFTHRRGIGSIVRLVNRYPSVLARGLKRICNGRANVVIVNGLGELRSCLDAGAFIVRNLGKFQVTVSYVQGAMSCARTMGTAFELQPFPVKHIEIGCEANLNLGGFFPEDPWKRLTYLPGDRADTPFIGNQDVMLPCDQVIRDMTAMSRVTRLGSPTGLYGRDIIFRFRSGGIPCFMIRRTSGVTFVLNSNGIPILGWWIPHLLD